MWARLYVKHHGEDRKFLVLEVIVINMIMCAKIQIYQVELQKESPMKIDKD